MLPRAVLHQEALVSTCGLSFDRLVILSWTGTLGRSSARQRPLLACIGRNRIYDLRRSCRMPTQSDLRRERGGADCFRASAGWTVGLQGAGSDG